MAVVEIRHARMTVDLVCHRHYGRTAGVVEQVLAANPGLAGLDAFLPLGTRIVLPDIAAASTPAAAVSLWD